MSKLWKMLVVCVVATGALLVPSMASATISSVFGTVTCTTQGRWRKRRPALVRQLVDGAGDDRSSFDGTPIDVSVGFPAASGSDNNYPVVGIYHGWGGSKITPSSATAQRWLKFGYAVFSITDRGWGNSCGKPSSPANTLKPPPCERGYIHLLSRRYEVRDAQTLLGKLADEGVINPQQIGANGGSYGGGMSLELGSLKDRVELENGSLIPWESPGGKPMKIAATAAEFPWTDIAQALQPNGSTLDYVANAPYSGMHGDHRFGIEKASWNAAVPHRRLERLLRADERKRPGSEHPELAHLQHHGRPLRRTAAGGSAGTAAAEPQRLLHRHVRAAVAGADGERLERRPVPGRRNGQVLQQGPRDLPEPADEAVLLGPRAQPALGDHAVDADATKFQTRRTHGSRTTSKAKAQNRPKPMAA